MLFTKLAAVTTFPVSVFAVPISVGVNANRLLAPVTDTLTCILQDLQIALNSLVIEINDLAADGVKSISGDYVTSVLVAVTGVIDSAATAVSNIDVGADVNVKHVVAVDEVAKLMAYVLTDIITVIETLKDAPLVEDLLPTIDGTIGNLVGGVNIVLAGVMCIVAQLVGSVVAIGQDLGLDGVLRVLRL